MKLTVVVPTLNEAAYLRASLESLPSEAEIIVSDGGSVDETIAVATRFGARIVTGSTGRAGQMNRGARSARGDALLFLHADCALGPGALAQIESALARDDVVGGSFRLVIRNASVSLRLIAATSNARARYLKIPYGDQAIFVTRSAFDAVGGFPEIPFMEDVAFARSLKRLGRLVTVDETVTTGARHWQRLGPIGTTLLNWSMVSLFLMGVPAKRLEPTYRRLRSGRSPVPSPRSPAASS